MKRFFLPLVGVTAFLIGLALSAPPPQTLLPDVLPNLILTPGATVPGVTWAQLCQPGYAKSVRNVTRSTKRRVYAEYHAQDKPGYAEVDHLISLELGGSNDQKNLWIEPYDLNVGGVQEGALEKDRAENATHAAGCRDEITLADAQKQIVQDWRLLYRRFVGPLPKYTTVALPGKP